MSAKDDKDPPKDDKNPPKDDKDPPKDDKDPKKDIKDFPEEAQKVIKELREENAKRRVEGKQLEENFGDFKKKLAGALGLDGKDEKPEEVAERLRQEKEKLEAEHKMTTMAYGLGIKKDDIDYFSYLYNTAQKNLDAGQTLPQKAFDDIVEKVNRVSDKSNNSSSVGGSPPSDGGEGGKKDDLGKTTLDEFLSMDFVAKSELCSKDAATYEKLSAEARKKGKSLIG